MSDTITILCGAADLAGRRLVIARNADGEHRDRFNTDDAFRRRRFAEATLDRFGWALTGDVLDEIDRKLLAEADGQDANRPPQGRNVEQVCLAEVPPARVDWLWPGRIALGKITLLAGDPGLGKSMVTLDIAARVSRAAAWPDQPLDGEEHRASAGSVILLSAEDDLADTVRPRLEAHGADCSRIVAIRAVRGSDDEGSYARTFDLGRDIEQLTEAIQSVSDCRLVVIDPISAYLGRTGENMNAEVRAMLGPLASLATEHGVAIVVVTHLRKGDGAAVYRTMGSLGFVAAARSAWMICRDENDARRRLLLPIKNNLSSDTGGLAYRIESIGPGGEPAICWSREPVEYTAGELAPQRERGRPAAERSDVCRWLREALADGPRTMADLREEAEAYGFSYGTLRRAFQHEGGRPHRDAETQRWLWSLPG